MERIHAKCLTPAHTPYCYLADILLISKQINIQYFFMENAYCEKRSPIVSLSLTHTEEQVYGEPLLPFPPQKKIIPNRE